MACQLDDSRRLAHGIGPQLRAGAAFIVIVMLSVGLGWSIWAALRSLVTAVVNAAGHT
jgi:hypothetical protein